MKINNTTYVIVLMVFVQTIFGQKTVSKKILGQILEQSTSVEAVNIINNATQVTAFSDVNGMFSIVVKEGDVLVLSAVNMQSLRYRVTDADFSSGSIQIKMETKEIQLNEVIVNENVQINAENLGIVSKNQKKYTVAERRLATAGDFKPIALLGLLGGSMQLDPLLNKINGRTKKLKKNIEIEKKEAAIKQLGYLFEDVYFGNDLKIPSEHIGGFKFYLVESDEVMLFLKNKEKAKLEFLINKMALQYNEIISSENK